MKNVTTINKPTPKKFKDGANLLFRELLIANTYASKVSSRPKLTSLNRFVVYVWTGETDAKTVRRKKVAFSNEYGYLWTGAKGQRLELNVYIS